MWYQKQGQEACSSLCPETAKGMGLEVNNNVDERYNLAKSTPRQLVNLFV
jgi:hypothetical protein